MTEPGHVRVHQCPACGETATEPGVTDHVCDPDMPTPEYTGMLATLAGSPTAAGEWREIPIPPGERWTQTRGRFYDDDPPESPYNRLKQATLHIGDTEIPVNDIQFDWTRNAARDAENYTTLRAGGMTDVSYTFEVPPEQAGPIAAFVMGVYRHPSHDFAVSTLRAFRIKPRDIGVDLGCACHTLPNPAARDYRRRTKHRNRRRR